MTTECKWLNGCPVIQRVFLSYSYSDVELIAQPLDRRIIGGGAKTVRWLKFVIDNLFLGIKF